MWKESETEELKESLNVEDILETVCAFANSRGGIIHVGISDNGLVRGVTIGKNTLENLANDISRNLDPPVSGIGIDIVHVDDRQILRITVPASLMRPHFYHRKAYCRIGKSNHSLSASQLEALYVKKLSGTHGIDTQIIEGATEADIDDESLREYTKEIGVQLEGKMHALQNFNLYKNGQVLASAILFFGAAPERFFPLYGFKCSVMAGNEIIEMADFRESIYKSIEKVVNFVMRNIPASFKIEGVRRVEIPRISRAVIREAIVNAAIHRDYSIGSGIFVQISHDSVIIKNPGVLPPTIALTDLYKTHHSEPRNRLLAELAFKVKLIEHWGTGTVKMVAGMRANGLDDPIFRENKGYFEVILPLSEPELAPRQKKVLESLKRGAKDIYSLVKVLKVSERTARTDLEMLARKGFIKKERAGRTIRYYV
jgi:ATP-dependent DNA helicase RecG